MKATSLSQQLGHLQRELYEKALQEALSLDLLGFGLLGRYAEDYERSLPDDFSPSCLTHLSQTIMNSEIILYGDFHTLKQSQRGLLRVLRHLPQPQSVVLAMEMFASEDQAIIDSYMADEIAEIDFLSRLDYDSKWGFPWQHYSPIVQWAKDAQVKLYGINSSGSVMERDVAIANRLVDLKKQHPQQPIIMMIGEHHLADQHIPLQLAQKGFEHHCICRIFTNAEKYYFSEQRTPGHSTDYLDLGRNRFCILNSPPWIKWQSVAIYSELRSTGYDDTWYEDDEREGESADERFWAMLQSLVRFLQVEAPVGLDDFYIYRHSSAGFYQYLRDLYPKNTASTFMSIADTEGALFPLQGRGVLISEFTQNNLIQLAGEYLRGRTVKNPINPLNKRELFLAVLFSACAGRVASKIFNPRRKGLTFEDVEAYLHEYKRRRLLGAAKQHRASLKLLLHLHGELLAGKLPSTRARIWDDDAQAGFMVARNLGTILGQEIYQGVMRGIAPTQLMTDLFLCTVDPATYLTQVYALYHSDRLKVPA